MIQPLFVELYASSPMGLRAQTVAAADETLRQGATTLVLGLDNLPTLDDAAISATIVALRKLRESGGTVRLATRNADHRRHLALTGLDVYAHKIACAHE
jgi:anti-anti-sigma regulatory factor